jgi:prolycopene isomerase
MSEQYDAIIIGAGIGGLTAGNILAKNGMKVLILEKNHVAGGAATLFRRQNFPLDIAHSICGLNNKSFMDNMLKYIGIRNKIEAVPLSKVFICMDKQSGKLINCYTDLERFYDELSGIFPDERRNIKDILAKIVNIWHKEILKSFFDPNFIVYNLYPFMFPNLAKLKYFSFDRLLGLFTNNDRLKQILSAGWPYLGERKESLSALYMSSMLGAYHADGAFFIRGGIGSLPVALEERFRGLGGKILYKADVNTVATTNSGVATGVITENNEFYLAKKVISNIDSKRTLNLLPDKIRNKFNTKISNMKMSLAVLQIHLFSRAEVPENLLSTGSIILDSDYDYELGLKARMSIPLNKATDRNKVLILSINPLRDFVPDSEDLFVFNLGWAPADYKVWEKFRVAFGDKDYEISKSEIINIAVKELNKLIKIREVRFAHVLTPLSFEKWMNATSGCIYDLATTPNQTVINRLKNVTRIKNFYLVGAKTFPGPGIPGAMFSGFALADLLLKGAVSKGKVFS